MTLRSILRRRTGGAVVQMSSPQSLSVWQQPADLALAGPYFGSDSEIGGIDARWGDGSWTNIAASVSGGTFSGTLTGCAAGPRVVQIRASASVNVTFGQQIGGVGEVFAVAGQSNAAGSLTNFQTYSHASLLASMISTTTWSNLRNKSPWPLVATSLMADQGVATGWLMCALGSTTIAQWQPGNESGLYANLVSQINNAGGVRACVWWQGESDVSAGTAEATYNAGLDTVANNLYAATGAKMVVCKLQNWGNPANLAAINSAIATAWSDNANVIAGPDFSDLTPSDGPHFVTDEEAATIAGRWWTALQTAFYS